MTSENLIYLNLLLYVGHVFAAVRLARAIGKTSREQAVHRGITAGLGEKVDGTRNRLTQVEMQLGRTMRHTGVPGREEPLA